MPDWDNSNVVRLPTRGEGDGLVTAFSGTFAECDSLDQGELAMTLSKSDRDQLYDAEKTIRRLKGRERKNSEGREGGEPEGRSWACARQRLSGVATSPAVRGSGAERPRLRRTFRHAARALAQAGRVASRTFQRKPSDRRANPLCSGAHELQHSMAELRFWSSFEPISS